MSSKWGLDGKGDRVDWFLERCLYFFLGLLLLVGFSVAVHTGWRIISAFK